jgi:NADH:ubiquinone oxidoreductase subunit C
LNIFFNLLPNIFLILKKYNIFFIFTKNIAISLYCYKIFSFLKYHCFVNLFVIDAPTDSRRFSLNYLVQSFKNNNYINFINQINELTFVNSVTFIFFGAGWPEREAWDMFGIFFLNHNNMQRLLSDYGFEGYPLRKDFPLSGFIELFYNEKISKILYEKIDLIHEHRNFFFDNIWSVSK